MLVVETLRTLSLAETVIDLHFGKIKKILTWYSVPFLYLLHLSIKSIFNSMFYVISPNSIPNTPIEFELNLI